MILSFNQEEGLALNDQVMAFQLELLFRLVLACICGFIIGYERKARYKPAGVKTHTIVALASALMMIVSKYGFGDVMDYDAARVAAQVVSGVSFLGAGIIIKKNQNVEGLTTAALIWGMAGIGLAVGAGMYVVALGATALYLIVSWLIRHVEHRQTQNHASYRLTITSMDCLKKLLSEEGHLVSYSVEKSEAQRIAVRVMLVFANNPQKDAWESGILANEDIISFEQLL